MKKPKFQRPVISTVACRIIIVNKTVWNVKWFGDDDDNDDHHHHHHDAYDDDDDDDDDDD